MGPLVLCILDGVGMREEKHGNAFLEANTPNFDYLWKNFPHCLLDASGTAVGLPEGQMGNSEVGHLNIGAGRIVYQPLEMINRSISDNSFFRNKAILDVIKHVKRKNSTLHLLGLLSDGGVHSHINHLFALLELCKQQGVNRVYIHAFLDGRDTDPNSGLKYLDQLNAKIMELGIGSIATISGRYYAMDRDNRWDRIDKAYQAIVDGLGEKFNSYQEAINSNYEKGITDEFVIPAVIDKQGMIEDNDGLITFNFRPDRLRELFGALTDKNNKSFERTILNNLKLTTMMPVSDEVIYKYAYDFDVLKNTLGEYLSKNRIKQLRIAETEKYAHVTYFFDGGIERKLKNCDRILIPSPKVATYDLKPEMSALEITETLGEKLGNYDVVILNYANGDMVGHTGVYDKTIKAVETLDMCLGSLFKKIYKLGGKMILIADHGNCEYMLDEQERPVTSHSTSKVPCIVSDLNVQLRDGKLSDVAPTMLTMLNLKVPKEMTGQSLIK